MQGHDFKWLWPGGVWVCSKLAAGDKDLDLKLKTRWDKVEYSLNTVGNVSNAAFRRSIHSASSHSVWSSPSQAVKPRNTRNQNRTIRAARNLLGMATMEGWIKGKEFLGDSLVFQSGALFLAICYILEQNLYFAEFWAKMCHLHCSSIFPWF